MYEILDQHSVLEPTALDAFPNLKQFQARIRGLPKIAAYMKSDKFISYPLNGVIASFGAK